MSSSFCAPKISEVLQFLSEQPDDVDHYENACAMLRSSESRSKQVFTDAVNYCMLLLRKTGRMTNHQSEVLSDEATLMGHEMYERIINVDVQMDVETEDEDISNICQQQMKVEPQEYLNDYYDLNVHTYSLATETEETTPVTSPLSSRSSNVEMKNTELSPSRSGQDVFCRSTRRSSNVLSNNFDDKQLPPSPVSLSGSDISDRPVRKKNVHKSDDLSRRNVLVPLELKIKVLALARAHPTWSLKKLQEKASVQLRNMEQLKQWEKQVENGGTMKDKFRRINTRTYERFVEARAKSQRVSSLMLRQWAVRAAKECYGSSFKFDGSVHWWLNFKRAYSLHGSNMHGFFKSDEPLAQTTIEEFQLLEKKNRRRQSEDKFKGTA